MNRWLAGNIAWPLTERLLGRDTMRRYRRLLATDHADAEALAAIQNAKLRRLLALADEHCPFYRERFRSAGIDPRDPKLTKQALAALPLLTRAEVREHLDELTWRDCPGGPARLYNTGGSSGEPLQFYFDRCRQAADWASRWRTRRWWNLRPGDLEFMVWAGPPASTANDHLKKIRDGLLNQFVLDAFNMTDQTMAAYADRIRRHRPRMLYGYASSLGLLARYMLQHQGSLDPHQAPRAVFVTGETLSPTDAHDIEATFKAPVVIEYGSRDCGLIACGCPAGRLHVNDENMLIEVLDSDGQPAKPGQAGEIVVTSLEAFATPFIRYRVGDIGVLPTPRTQDTQQTIDGRCSCGRATMQLAEVRGRVTDQIVCRQGDEVRRMHALSLIYVLREVPCVQQFRITQPSLHELDVEVVADARFTPAIERSITAGLRSRLGPEVNVHIQRRERIAPVASGKHACVVSNPELCPT